MIQTLVYSRVFFFTGFALQEQQNFRNPEFRREILEFSEKSFHFNGGNLEFSLSLDEKSSFFAKNSEFRKFL